MINLILCSPENETCPVLSEIGITLNVMLPKCPSSRSVKNSRYFSILHICRITSSLFLLACFFTFDSDTTQISPTSFNHNFLLLIKPLQGLQWTVSLWFFESCYWGTSAKELGIKMNHKSEPVWIPKLF